MTGAVSRVYQRTLATLAVSIFAGLASAAVAGAAWGWAAFSFFLIVALGYHAWHLRRLSDWLEDPVPGKVPEGYGTWDDLLTALHRHEREGAKREQLLSETLIRFRRAAQALPDGVVILDSDNRIEWCNDTASAYLGLDPVADVGQAIANLVREPAFVDYLAQGEHGERDAVQIHSGLSTILAVKLIPYGESQKLLLARDVTQAERIETMRRDFVANVSHELRTPLTVLVGFLETVRELKLDPQRTRDYLGMMQEQAARMHRIIEDLLTLSVLESAPPPPSERVRVAPLLERLRTDAEALSGGRHVITLEGRPTVDLLGAETEISSAFGNLVTNAIRYTPAGGTVKLLWRDPPEGPSFTVEDTGIGISPEHLPRLTERFYRVDRSRSRETGGTGLGLA
ncbi:MAG: phosphate regulon sensor histidine kinase PhoR, partial [Betaproteobacteria bacterium]|nr:phosphate regulon sensor histidine kinase PhoR [Betaproteobacteria bacterium]